MLSGRRLNLLDPSPLDIEIEDIAHGLARVGRWNGQTSGDWAFSVAQHSLLVLDLFCHAGKQKSSRWQLACLLHDAPEYVIGDMITPFKAILDQRYRQIEENLQQAVHIRFGLPASLPQNLHRQIKQADRQAAWLEATQLAGFSETEARVILRQPRQLPAFRLEAMPPSRAAEAFLQRFHQLSP